jgi:hypothetical protein
MRHHAVIRKTRVMLVPMRGVADEMLHPFDNPHAFPRRASGASRPRYECSAGEAKDHPDVGRPAPRRCSALLSLEAALA